MFKVPTAMEALRKSKQMSQVVLANRISKYQVDISNYENGSSIPTAGVLERIAAVLEFNGEPADLLKPFYKVFSTEGLDSQDRELSIAA